MSAVLHLLAAPALLIGAQAALAAEETPSIIVNRAGAGALDESGWTAATSSKGRFAAQFPCLYDDYISNDPAQPEIELHWLNCQRVDGVRFAVMRNVGQSPETAKAGFDSLAADKRFNPVPFKGMPGYSYATMADGKCARVMMVWTGQDMIMAIAERISGEANCLGILADANTFVQSLEVDR